MNIEHFKSILLSALALVPHILAAQSDAEAFFKKSTEEEWLRQASAAFAAVRMSGDTLAFCNGEKMMIPASTMKVMTTGAALHSLGHDFRFQTGIGYHGEIIDGVLKGDLYIIGGGDPTLGSRDSIATPVEKTFATWRSFLRQAGIRKIDGYIIGDSRYFDSEAEIESWQWNDIGTYYGTGVSGLSFHENMQDMNVSPGDAPGKPLKIKTGYPDLPWMEYRFRCSTGKAGTGNSLYLYTTPFAPYGEMRGTLAVDRSTKTEKVSNKFPAYTCAWHFCRYLESCGISCRKGAAQTGDVFGPDGHRPASPADIVTIGTTCSPELSRIAFETNHQSNNMFAETIYKTLGKEYCGDGSYSSASAALSGILKETGTDTGKGIRIEDGSGLSRQNSISPAAFCSFLSAMMSSPDFGYFAESLPYPGGNGTLAYTMREYPESSRQRIRMKSGSMTGVRCYCGYIIPKEGCREDTIVFAVMVNSYFGSSSRLQNFLDRLIFLLSEEN